MKTVKKQMKQSKKFTFGFIGTFAYWHGVEVLEAIIVALLREKLPVHFLMIGDGVLLPQMKTNLKGAGIEQDFVTFTGIIPQEQGPEYLAQCDVYLCPTQPNKDGSPFFGSPTKLFEYMSMAKPIIASDLEQLSEVVSPAIKITRDQQVVPLVVQKEVGILVDPLDIQGFINACKFCYHLSPEMQQKMGNNARQKVLEKYTWKEHVERIITHAGL